MQHYEFHLDKTSRKYVCPHCHHKSFVVYVDSQNKILSPEVGRCDRLDKCHFHYPPREFFNDHSSLSIRTNQEKYSFRQKQVVPSPSFIPDSYLRRTLTSYGQNSLYRFLACAFGKVLCKARIEAVISDYLLGTAKMYGGSPVFWQVDRLGRVHTGKIMGYDDTGHRIKNPHPQMQWAHTALKDCLDGDFTLSQTFYGAHRPRADDSVYWLFESEKTALITALALKCCGDAEYRKFIPIAAGGCEGFNPTPEAMSNPYHRIQLLRNQCLVLFPDNGKYEHWKLRAGLVKRFCKSVEVSAILEPQIHRTYYPKVPVNPSDDLGDIILRYLDAGLDVTELITAFQADEMTSAIC